MGRKWVKAVVPCTGLGLALALWMACPGSPTRAQGPDLPGGLVPDHGTGDLPTIGEAIRRPPARPPTPYPITPQAGAWMICAASYTGADAPELARQVVVELRNRHRLAAWIFNHGEAERREQEEHWKRIEAMYPGVELRRRMVRIPDQCAVLVGGYESMESATKDLKKVRALPLPRLDLGPDKTPYDMMTVAEPDPKTRRMRIKQAPINPFHTAFVTRNPTAPVADAPKQEKFDPFWKTLNAYEPYSLLKCKKKWTLAVKEYKGYSVIQPQNVPKTSQLTKVTNKLMNLMGLAKQKPGDALGAAAKQANTLAEFLRDPKLGFESYVLHTRVNSIVTVGGFDSLDDPELVRMQQRLARLRFNDENRYDPVGLFRKPMPMEVPKY